MAPRRLGYPAGTLPIPAPAPLTMIKIITGDLAQVGSDLLVRLAAEGGCDLRPRYTDCGLMLHDREGQRWMPGPPDAGAAPR